MTNSRFTGKRILVTGASSGIGFQIAKLFLQEGAIVGAHYNNNKERALELLSIDTNDKCQIFQTDLSTSQGVSHLWENYMDWAGNIDVLVNNAATIETPDTIANLSETAWDKTFDVNLKAPWLLSRAAASVMRKNSNGRIINIASIGVKYGGGFNSAHYSVSKAALEALTISLAKEGAPDNVLVNAIRAGVTDTELHKKLNRNDLDKRAQLVPIGRLADAREIANVVLFLASEDSTFITGSVITVAGGE